MIFRLIGPYSLDVEDIKFLNLKTYIFNFLFQYIFFLKVRYITKLVQRYLLCQKQRIPGNLILYQR